MSSPYILRNSFVYELGTPILPLHRETCLDSDLACGAGRAGRGYQVSRYD